MRMIPSKKICEKFNLTYELEGCQTTIDFLTKHYKRRRMRIVLDGREVRKSHVAHHEHNTAFFTKRGLTKRTVLHKLYHHIADVKGLKFPLLKKKEEPVFFPEAL